MKPILCLLLLAIGAFPAAIQLTCNPAPVNLLPTGLHSVSCPGFSVVGGSIQGAAVSVYLYGTFSSLTTATDTSDFSAAGSPFTFPSVVNSITGIGTVGATFSGISFGLLPGTLNLPFTVLAHSSVSSLDSVNFQACYVVDYSYTGTGTAVGAEGGPCRGTFNNEANTPEPASVWLVLPVLAAYRLIRQRCTSRTTSGSHPSHASLLSAC